MDRDKFGDLGLGGYEYLHRGLSNMSEAAMLDYDVEIQDFRGVSTSWDQRSNMGFN